MDKSQRMQGLALIVLLAIFFAGLFSVSAAPVFSLLCLTCLGALFVFVKAEDNWHLHSSSEAENRFWTLFTTVLSASVMFAPDSPIPLGKHYPMLGSIVVVAAVMWVHSRERAQVREALSRPSGLVRSSSIDLFDQVNIDVARGMAAEIAECVQRLDFQLVPLKIGYRTLIEEQYRKILSLLDGALPDQLDYIVSSPKVKLPLLLSKVKDHDIMAWKPRDVQQPRTAILRKLCFDRLGDLQVPARANIVDAIQRLRVSAHEKNADYVLNIFRGTLGFELTKLKLYIDNKVRFGRVWNEEEPGWYVCVCVWVGGGGGGERRKEDRLFAYSDAHTASVPQLTCRTPQTFVPHR